MSDHKKENAILLSALVATTLLLLKCIPRNQLREALIPFLFSQVVTWICGLFVVEKKLIQYPYRLFFKTSCKSCFAFEYFFFPALTALYNCHYPEKRSPLFKALYTSFYSGAIAILEVPIEKYTNLITYKKWKWQWSFLSMSMVYYLSRVFSRWFFKGEWSQNKDG